MSIPTRHRDALRGESEGALVVTISPSDRCLLLYRLDDWEQVERKLTALPTLNAQTRQLKRMLIGHADDCVMDSSGRILLPPQLREFAGIDRKAVLVGQGESCGRCPILKTPAPTVMAGATLEISTRHGCCG